MPINDLLIDASPNAVPLHLFAADEWDAWIATRPDGEQAWTKANEFTAKPGSICVLPGKNGDIAAVLAGMDNALWSAGGLPGKLPAGDYMLAGAWEDAAATEVATGFLLGGYTFGRYKDVKAPKARLLWPGMGNHGVAEAIAKGVCLARDLLNTPANDMGGARRVMRRRSCGWRAIRCRDH